MMFCIVLLCSKVMPAYILSRNLITLGMKEKVVKLNFLVILDQSNLLPAIGQENDDIILVYRPISWMAQTTVHFQCHTSYGLGAHPFCHNKPLPS